MRRSSLLRPGVLLSVIALLAQLLLPSVHAASMARHGDGALAYVFCGDGTAMRAALYAALPAELKSAIAPDTTDDSRAKTNCALCTAVCGMAFIAGGNPAPIPAVPDHVPFTGIGPALHFSTHDQAPRPPTRAPPVFPTLS